MKVIALFGSLIAVPLLVTEASDWLPSLARWLTRRAARALPPEFHERYIEEWSGELDALPGGKLTQLAFALRVCTHAPSTGCVLRGTPARLGMKNVLDPLLASVFLLLAAPAMLVIALAIRLTSHGPAIYRDRRLGRDGQEFTFLKFRTMRSVLMTAAPEPIRADNTSGPSAPPGHELRMTKVGHLLRQSALDELPQLFNVLIGSMSLVGPRPHRASATARDDTNARRRMLVKPGLTGLCQISGRSTLSTDETTQLDIGYVEAWSLALDLRILASTAPAILRSIALQRPPSQWHSKR